MNLLNLRYFINTFLYHIEVIYLIVKNFNNASGATIRISDIIFFLGPFIVCSGE
jgi:hypothetical protein